jgi:hypothetical protein
MANGNPVILGNADTSTKQTTITAITPAKDAGLRVQNYNGTGIAAGALKGTALTAGSVGGAAIVAESATVALDETFAKLVTCKDYHVFLTPEGDCNGLYVQRKTSSGFEVRELQKGTSAVSVSYRIVARRRDVKGKRLEIVELGRLPEKADAMLATPKPSGKESKGRLADELTALARQGKQKKKPASRAKKK